MLIAQELTHYGLDIYKKEKPELLDTIKVMESVDPDYAHPPPSSMEILDVMAENDKICKYLDMLLQHASIRCWMLRGRENQRGTIALIQAIRNKKYRILLQATTMLVGFPGETEQTLKDYVIL